MDYELLVWAVGTIVGLINIGLLLGLLSVYWKSYRKTKSKFAVGLLFFGSMFLLRDVFSMLFMIVFSIDSSGAIQNGSQGDPFGFLITNLIESVALAILFKITWE
ncbi:MAG: hypothetical protein HZB92_00095 [Euryarchaeota archaeon]|nr:hypothetical protein [Euryarchaeota archaeon]